jgi:hypothetical protein
VNIRLEQDADGRLVATGLLIEADRELMARDLRFRLADVVTGFASAASKPATQTRLWSELLDRLGIEYVQEGATPSASQSRGKASTRLVEEAGSEAANVPDQWRWLLPVATRRALPRRTRPGPKGHDDAFYRGITDAYMRALREQPQRPIQTLMEHFGYEEAQMHRHLRGAEARGFLSPRTRGRSSARKER